MVNLKSLQVEKKQLEKEIAYQQTCFTHLEQLLLSMPDNADYKADRARVTIAQRSYYDLIQGLQDRLEGVIENIYEYKNS